MMVQIMNSTVMNSGGIFNDSAAMNRIFSEEY